uniref:G-protein coupled receptors family 1 profile domain-containing protein n=1 Tax=Sinocyclocheilus grahami TaxID=75366 RepID=A0A672JZ13_SINGR
PPPVVPKPGTKTSSPSTNSTDATVKYLKNINVFLHCIICVLGVAGNGMVIYIAGLKMKRTVNTIWFLNLAVADFLFLSLIFTIIYKYRDSDWPFGDFICMLSSLVTVLNMFASTFLLTAISLDRCLSTWVVVWARTKRTVLKSSFGKHIPILRSKPCAYLAFQVCSVFLVGFLIPFVIILASYMAIGVRVKRLRKDNKLKSFCIILAVILAFFFCWLPFYIYKFLEVWLCEMYDMGLFIVSLAYLNSCLNPFFYVFMCEEFQKKLKQSLVMVFESTFSEEHLAVLSQYSQYQRKSHSQSGTGPSLTQSLTLEG